MSTHLSRIIHANEQANAAWQEWADSLSMDELHSYADAAYRHYVVNHHGACGLFFGLAWMKLMEMVEERARRKT